MSLSETLCDEVVDGVRRRAYKQLVTGVDPETEEPYEFEMLFLTVEILMADGHIWAQTLSAQVGLWDDKPALEKAWQMAKHEASINIQEEVQKKAKADDTS
jgi:hypothetical protein